MNNAFNNKELLRNQEMYRAQAIVQVAEKDGKDIARTLRDYGVAQSIINELGMEVAPITPKNKKVTTQHKLNDWAKAHFGEIIKGGFQIVEDTGLSYATANNFIQSRKDLFTRIKKGEYLVNEIDEKRLVS